MSDCVIFFRNVECLRLGCIGPCLNFQMSKVIQDRAKRPSFVKALLLFIWVGLLSTKGGLTQVSSPKSLKVNMCNLAIGSMEVGMSKKLDPTLSTIALSNGVCTLGGAGNKPIFIKYLYYVILSREQIQPDRLG